MRRISTIIFILLVILAISSCELFMQEPEHGKVYAIFVALDYKATGDSLDPLDGPLNDAEAQRKAFSEISKLAGREFQDYSFLQEGDKEREDIPIGSATINTYPTLDNLKKALTALATITTENDLIIFTFSGHALGGEIVLKKGWEERAVASLVPASDIFDHFAPIAARKLIILDACETGLAIPPSGESSSTLLENSISKWYAKYFTQTAEQDRSLYVMSSSANTDSYEEPFDNGEWHGVFTYALLEGLGWNFGEDKLNKGLPPAARDGRLTVDGLLRYIKKNQKYLLKRSFINPSGNIQHPMVTGGARDMVLFTF